jgi:hypothetical protein
MNSLRLHGLLFALVFLAAPCSYADKQAQEQSRADVAVAEQSTVEVKGVEVYPRGTGPRGVVSFARFTLAVPIEKDENGTDKICLRPGFSPGEKSPSFGVLLQVSF